MQYRIGDMKDSRSRGSMVDMRYLGEATMAEQPGRRLMTAGAVVMIIGLGIVLVRVYHIPEYWMPLLVGLGIFVCGLIRWLTSRDQRRS
jgi:hypothetical protein